MKCLLYEARKHPKYDADTENVFLSELEKIDPNLGFAHINKAKSPHTEMAETKFGKSSVGSFLSYQTSLTESNFSARVDLTSVPRVNENKRRWAIRNKENRNIIERKIIISMYKQTDRNVNKTMSHLFTSSAFVLRPFAGSPLHRNQNFDSWFFSSEGFRPNKDAPGISSSVRYESRVVEPVAMLD